MDSPAKHGQVLTIEFDREEDGRWIAEVPELPGVLAYGDSKDDAARRVQALAYRVIADKIENERMSAESVTFERREHVA